MQLNADRDGFLVGMPIGGDEGIKHLRAIRTDLRGLRKALIGSAMPARLATPPQRSAFARQRDAGGRFAGPARSAVLRSPPVQVAQPQRRATLPQRAGDGVAGRAGGQGAVPAQRIEAVAEAVGELAKANEKDRLGRDAEARTRARDGRGRFGAGGGQEHSAGSRLGGLASSVGAAASRAAIGAEKVDPLLEAIGEAKNFAATAAGVVAPIGRSLQGVLGRKKDDGTGSRSPIRWMRRQWQELRDMRKEQKAGNRALLAAYKQRSGEGGSGLAALLTPLLSAGGALAGVLGGALAGIVTGAIAMLGRGLLRFGGLFGAAVGGWSIGGAIYERYAEQIQGFIERAETAWTSMTAFVTDKWTSATAWVSDTFEPARKLFADLAEWVSGLSGFKAVQQAGGDALDKARARGSELLKPFRDAGSAIMEGVKDGWDAVKPGAKGAADSLNARWDRVKGALTGAASAAGVDPSLVAKIANVESGFNADARPVRRDGSLMSSAHGLGQFVDSTWLDTLRRHGSKYGVANASQVTREQAAGMRGDTSLQAAMLAELTKENVALGKKLGGADDATNAYLLHNLGQGDGSKFLKGLAASPDAAVSSVLSAKVIANNRSLYGDGSMSMKDAYARIGKKLSGGAASFGAEAKALLAAPALGGLASSLGLNSAMLNAPSAPSAAAPVSIPPAPTDNRPVKLSGNQGAAVPVQAPPAPARDVPDRTLAHVATGGMAGSPMQR